MENKKFKLTDETITNGWGVTLSRIVALKDFRNVKTGDEGGFVEKEENLSHKNDCWIFDNAKVSGEARVCDEARVFGEARVFDEARVFGEAQVFGEARVFDEAQVSGEAWVCDEARVFGEAQVSGEARVCDEAQATTVVKTFGNAFCYGITVTDKHIKIGCRQHLKSEWLNFQEGEIIEMDGKRALKFWRIFKPLAEQLGLFEEI